MITVICFAIFDFSLKISRVSRLYHLISLYLFYDEVYLFTTALTFLSMIFNLLKNLGSLLFERNIMTSVKKLVEIKINSFYIFIVPTFHISIIFNAHLTVYTNNKKINKSKLSIHKVIIISP